DFATYYCQQY
nr:immunoglobulin light chain junction region [Homo sapiens]MCE37415.1 immunoglobulin light chain junction region [Homo sapiens]